MFGPVVQVVALSDDEKKSIYQDSVHYDRPDESDCTTSESIVLSGNNNTAKAFDYFVNDAQGPRLKPHQAAGIIGNLLGESSLIPDRKQGGGMQKITSASDIKPNVGYGIAQWTSEGRQKNWIKFSRDRGLDPLKLETQLQYLVHELETNPGYGYKEIKQAKDVEQATWIFLAYFERPAAVSGHTAQPNPPNSGEARAALKKRVELANGAIKGSSSETPVDSSSDTISIEGSSDDASCSDKYSKGSSFNAATFNVLGSGHTPTYKDRADKSIGVIQDNKIDVVGVQEFTPKQRSYFMTKLSNYDNFPKGSSNKGHRIENSILWNKDKFSYVDGGIQPNLKYFCGSGLDAPWVKLKDIKSNQEIFVLNTHDPASTKCPDQSPGLRLENANKYVSFTSKLQKNNPDVPIIFTGDFNSGFDVVGMNRPVGNKAKNLTYCVLNDGGVMKDAYDLFKKRDYKCPNPKPKADRENDANGVDHVFVSKGTDVTNYKKVDMQTNGADHPTQIFNIAISSGGGAGEGAPNFNKKYNVKYDGAGSSCAKGTTIGAKSLSDVVMKKYSPPVSSVGGFSCRANTANPSELSVHSTGRALDIMIDGTTPKGRETGDRIRNFMINNAEKLGVQMVIWNKHIWSVNQKGWRSYGGPNPHTDHLHVEINIAASKKSNLGEDL